MHVDDDGVGPLAERAGVELALDGGEGIVERGHQHPPHDVDHQHLRAPFLVEAGPRRGPGFRRGN